MLLRAAGGKPERMNYRHAFHAGNFADVHKHWILMLLLERLSAKDKPFFVLDSHAGAGFYDLTRDESSRTGEAADGIARLFAAEDRLPDSFTPYLDAVRRLNPGMVGPDGLRWYPGSPWLISASLRLDDRLSAVEAHPEQARLLQESLSEFRNARVYERDGYEAVPSMLPPKEKRGLTLIDPPYERPDEVSRIAKAVSDGVKRFATGTIAIWYPIKTNAIGDALVEALPVPDRGGLRCEIFVTAPDSDAIGLTGSGMILLNPIWPIEDRLREGLPVLSETLARDGGAGWRLEAL